MLWISVSGSVFDCLEASLESCFHHQRRRNVEDVIRAFGSLVDEELEGLVVVRLATITLGVHAEYIELIERDLDPAEVRDKDEAIWL